MRCPQCNTENRDERGECYHCGQDLSMLRLVLNRARNHYNAALEHAERDRNDEAISELKHAVELDSTFINAWVVLGTVYAKREMFAEARDAWQKALALDPRLEKAHTYLQKAETVASSIPALRRLQFLAAGLAILAIGAFGGLALKSRPDTAASSIQRALDLAGGKRTGEAITALAEAESRGDAPRESRRIAAFMKTQLTDDLGRRLEHAKELVDAGSYRDAREVMAALEDEQPPAPIMEEIAALHSKIESTLSAKALAVFKRFEAGAIGYEQFNQEIAQYQNGSGEGSPVGEYLRKAKAIYDNREGDAALERIKAEMNLVTAALEADAAAKKFPDRAEEFQSVISNRLEIKARRDAGDLDIALLQRNFAKAKSILNETKSLFASVGRPAPADLIAAMENSIRAEETKIGFEEIQMAYEARDWAAVIAQTDNLAESTFTQKQRDEISIWRRQALTQTAVEAQKWMASNDVTFSDPAIRMSTEEASRILDTYRAVLDHHPAPGSFSRRTVVLYAALASLKLDRKEDAAKLLDESLEGTPFDWFVKRVESIRERYGLAPPGGGAGEETSNS